MTSGMTKMGPIAIAATNSAPTRHSIPLRTTSAHKYSPIAVVYTVPALTDGTAAEMNVPSDMAALAHKVTNRTTRKKLPASDRRSATRRYGKSGRITPLLQCQSKSLQCYKRTAHPVQDTDEEDGEEELKRQVGQRLRQVERRHAEGQRQRDSIPEITTESKIAS